MPDSQRTYEARATRFANANALIQSWGDYNPTNNPDIIKANLNTFEGQAIAINTQVALMLEGVNTPRGVRKPLCFKIKDTNPACLELRIAGVTNYVKGEFKTSSATYKTLKRVMKLIRPKYDKKDPDAPRGEGRSPSEKSFASLVGHGDTVIASITALGGSYSPPDPDLSVVNITALVAQIRQLNKDVTLALEPYGTINRSRKDIFDSKINGMNVRIAAIKSYLASFQGGKKSSHYIEFSQAIKGD